MSSETTKGATPEQIALLRGAQAVPTDPLREMWEAVNKLDDEMAAGGFDGRGCSIEQAWNCFLAATPPAYAEALNALLDGYEAMQADHQLALLRARRDQVLHLVELAQDMDAPAGILLWLRMEAGKLVEIPAALAKLGEKV